MSNKKLDEVSNDIIGAAMEVHKYVGPGYSDSVYHKCLDQELKIRGLRTKTRSFTPFQYKGISVDCELKLDILVEDSIVVEVKTQDNIVPSNETELLDYMKLLNKQKGVLINFNNVTKKDGIVFVDSKEYQN